MVAREVVAFGGNNTAGAIDVATACNAHGGSGRMDFESETFVVPVSVAMRGREGGGAAEIGDDRMFALRASSGGGDKPYVLAAQPIAFDTTQITSADNRCNPLPGDPCHPLASGAHAPAIAFDWRAGGDTACGTSLDGCPPVRTSDTVAIASTMAVRRLTPRECERLQGFPDDYTLIPLSHQARKQVEVDFAAYIRRAYPGITDAEMERLAKDGPRYKAIGNSMAVPVMRWIGERIAAVLPQ